MKEIPMKKPRSYLLLAVLASGVLWWVSDLSSSGRSPVDWLVVGVVVAAILWNLLGLGRRLRAAGGDKAVWHELRTLMFWLVGLMNTVWARPGAGGTWKWWVGIVLLLLAAADTIALYLKEQRSIASANTRGDATSEG